MDLLLPAIDIRKTNYQISTAASWSVIRGTWGPPITVPQIYFQQLPVYAKCLSIKPNSDMQINLSVQPSYKVGG